MKKLFLLIFAALLLPVYGAYAADDSMRVSADAEVRVKPDRAAITFGLSQKTANLRDGAARLNQVSRQVTAYLLKRGVEERFIQADGLSIRPVYTEEPVYTNTGRRTGKEKLEYELSQTFTVTLEDPSQYEDVLYSLLDMGVNRVENISFYSTSIRIHRDEARRLAVKYAREKAELLAEAAGVKLGKIVSVQEDSLPGWPGARYAASNISQNVYNGGIPAEESVSPATGMISVKAAVTLTYKIK